MAQTSENLNRKLYQLLSKYKPKMLSTAGKVTPVPEDAAALQFQFTKDGKDYGRVTVTIEDSNKLVVYFGNDVSSSPSSNTSGSAYSDSWSALLQNLKSWAQRKGQLGFELKDEDDLQPDMAKREDMNNKERVAEGYYPMGKKASYSDNVPAVKIILQHNRQLEEGEKRYRSIAKIFVENSEGERFAIPTNKPGLARVYARHIAEGGTPYDEVGKHINSLVEEYTQMAGFVRATRNGQFNESTLSLVNEAVDHYQSLRETLHKMSGRRGYQAYFENWSPTLTEDVVDTTDLSEMFANTALDPRIESVMPILSRLHKKVAESAVDKEVNTLAEWADSLLSEEEGLTSNNPVGIPEDVAEGSGDQVKKVFKKNGKPVGEVGIDSDASPGLGGQWYMKFYAGKNYDEIDLSGYESYEEAVAELKHCLKQVMDEGLTGAGIGAALGGALGSVVPGLGTAAGAALGGYAGHKIQQQGISDKKQVKEVEEDLDANQKRVGQLGPLEKAKNISPVLGSNPKKHPFNGKLVGADESIEESEERPYVCVHAKKGKCEVKASSSYQAAQKAAQKWGLKGTAGIDAHLADVEKDTSSLEESTDELARILTIMNHKR